MRGVHTPEVVCRDVVHTIESLCTRTGISRLRLLVWAGIGASRYHRWRQQQTMPCVPFEDRPSCASRLLQEERDAIVAYRQEAVAKDRATSYRIQAYEMLDLDIVAVSESSVYRVLRDAGLIPSRTQTVSSKGTGFVQPLALHEHWHTDISYLWEFGHRAYLISVLEGRSRAILHHKVLHTMKTGDVELVLQRTQELYPGITPRLITDNGGQFVSKQFKGFLEEHGYQHVRTSPNHPQANGKMERQFRTTKEALRERSTLDFDDMVSNVDETIHAYNHHRYHSAIGYVMPMDVLLGRAEGIQRQRRSKLDEAKERRKEVHSHLFN